MNPSVAQNSPLAESIADPPILVVDDVADNTHVLRRRLELRGYHVVCANSGPQALQVLTERRVAMILLDVMMPGMNGFEVLEEIHRWLGDDSPPVIMLTGRDAPEEIAHAMELGAVDYVVKPFDFRVLEARIRAQLKTAKSAGALRLRTSELEAHLRSLSDRQRLDPLTGLLNIRAFEAAISRSVAHARASATAHVLCICALEELQAINHTYGPATGDAVLRSVARALRQEAGADDTVARLRGDKFAILFADCGIEESRHRAERLLQRLTRHTVDSGEDTLAISVSIGLSPVEPDHPSVLAVIHAAEHACRLARAEGSNHIRTYRGGTQLEDVRANMRWATRLKQALREDALLLYAQPIVATARPDARPSRYEVLVRMADEGRIVSPGMFLPAIEKHGLATELDRWVVDHTLQYLAQLPKPLSGCVERISVNLSGHSLGSRRFRHYVIGRMRDAPIPPGMMCFEITETAAVVHLDRAVEFIRALRDLGVSFALDDFGSGVSSFGYLRSLPVDTLKVDGQFVRHMDTSPLDRGIVTAIHQIARVMSMETVAEFVENASTVAALRDIGVDYLQGYHLGRPEPLDHYLLRAGPQAPLTGDA